MLGGELPKTAEWAASVLADEGLPPRIGFHRGFVRNPEDEGEIVAAVEWLLQGVRPSCTQLDAIGGASSAPSEAILLVAWGAPDVGNFGGVASGAFVWVGNASSCVTCGL